jgi:glycosyltransferase involved in cell wall biosynthesis
MNEDTYIIIPVYNEAAVIKAVATEVLKKFSNVICVNDGSSDESAQEILGTKAVLINHPINLGQGAALQTGVDYSLQDPKARYFVTFDADGQHRLKDVDNMLRIIRRDDLDIVVGSRFLGEAKDITFLKKILLKCAIVFTNLTTGIRLTDTHNGLRVFGRRFAENLKITMADMTHASEITHRIAEGGYKYKEAPVTIHYSEYSKSKGQSSLNAVNIIFDLLMHKVSKK